MLQSVWNPLLQSSWAVSTPVVDAVPFTLLDGATITRRVDTSDTVLFASHVAHVTIQ